MSLRYSIREASKVDHFAANVFVMAGGTDERSLGMLDTLSKTNNCIKSVVLLKYDSFDEQLVKEHLHDAEVVSISVDGDSCAFLLALQEHKSLFSTPNILIDITSIRIPEMFTLLKYLSVLGTHCYVDVAYSTPVEYEFQEEPFTSYHSYYGNLKTSDLIGFGGMSHDMSHTQMVIFLGFEGVLSTKVNEDVMYEKLTLVNNLPSFYEKYKDISVINNYDLLTSRHERMAYVPANNPFETYNYLSEQLEEDEVACVAPLSTKPVALGVCLYALNHDALRVVYPMAEKYNHHRANSIHNTYVYSIPMSTI